MLHGRTYEDAAMLFASALAAEELGGARGTFVLMNGADPARGALDYQYQPVIDALLARGFDDVVRVPFDANTRGSTVAAFFTGAAGLGTTIEGNIFLPGSIADNLTSYGAVPDNFTENGESQVSIARFVASGVAGVHGTTDEPLNNCFPGRELLVDYVDGFTLGEAYFASLPFVYWRNLVLGDVMAAPYATRPIVQVNASDGETIAGDRLLIATASHPEGIARMAIYVNGATVAESLGDRVEVALTLPLEDVELLVVAQAAGDGAQSKGWVHRTVRGAAAMDAGVIDEEDDAQVTADAALVSDAAAFDGGTALGPEVEEEEGCACRGAGRPDLSISVLVFAGLTWLRIRRRAPRI
jgi:hypothetical protein